MIRIIKEDYSKDEEALVTIRRAISLLQKSQALIENEDIMNDLHYRIGDLKDIEEQLALELHNERG